MAINDGGPAFPATADQMPNDMGACYGMSLRDYFAAKAMALANEPDSLLTERIAEEAGVSMDEYCGSIHWPIVIAKRAYAYADAMLAERTK